MTIYYDDRPVRVRSGGIWVGGLRYPLAECLLEHLGRSHARGSRRLETWARRSGTPLRLLQTHDASRFGQIYRALPWAVESKPVEDKAVERNQPAGNR
jgi:hypothetical protein